MRFGAPITIVRVSVLIELGPQAISLVAPYFQQERDASVRKALVHIASQTNSANAISLITEALNDVEPSVWKEALDGLVSLGGPKVLEVMRQAGRRAPVKAEWFDEAIVQTAQDRSS